MEVLAEAAVAGPPVDAFGVARALGIATAMDDRQAGRARYVRLGGRRATILLRPEPRMERQQWAVAHEIGEHVAHRLFRVLGVDPCETVPNARETVANHLAGRILLPTDWFAADGSDLDWDLLELKARYATASHELIARRMLECCPAVIVTIFDNSRQYLRDSNVPGRAPPPSELEMRCWQSVHEHNRPDRSSDGQRSVQGWPVHEENWKREVLRMEVDELALDL